MLGEALKASASDESSGLPSVTLGSQAVGLLALLAVSGAVAILTLSKQKLWHYLFESTHATSIRLSTVASDFFSPNATCSSIHTASSVDDGSTTCMGARDSWDSRAEEVISREGRCGSFADDVSDSIARTGIFSAATADDPSSDETAFVTPACVDELAPVLTLQPSALSPTEPGIKTRHVLKKVQFAPDVVEPSGDGREYRGRIRTVRNVSNSMSSAGKLKGLHSGDELWAHPSSSTSGEKAVIKGDGYQILIKPKLPANRMVLYSGMLGYRSQMTRDC